MVHVNHFFVFVVKETAASKSVHNQRDTKVLDIAQNVNFKRSHEASVAALCMYVVAEKQRLSQSFYIS